MFISPGALTRLLSRSTIILPRSVRLARCWSASAVSGVGARLPAVIELLVSSCRDESELGRSGRERNAATCLLSCCWSVVGNLNVLALLLLVLLPFVPVLFVRGKAWGRVMGPCSPVGCGTSATLVTPGTGANANLPTLCILGLLTLASIGGVKGARGCVSCVGMTTSFLISRLARFKKAGKRLTLGDSWPRAVPTGSALLTVTFPASLFEMSSKLGKPFLLFPLLLSWASRV